MLVSQTKEIIKILLLRVHQYGRHDVRWKPAIANGMWRYEKVLRREDDDVLREAQQHKVAGEEESKTEESMETESQSEEGNWEK